MAKVIGPHSVIMDAFIEGDFVRAYSWQEQVASDLAEAALNALEQAGYEVVPTMNQEPRRSEPWQMGA